MLLGRQPPKPYSLPEAGATFLLGSAVELEGGDLLEEGLQLDEDVVALGEVLVGEHGSVTLHVGRVG